MSVSDQSVRSDGLVRAVLGPTNTGKTYAAIQAMLSHQTGVIGFPLRLLARENYDRVVSEVGAHAVALITGEEKIIPRQARYYLCTVESMPIEQRFEFVAIDEVQLAEDPDRGHIFTDRILRARGLKETMFMGADTMRAVLNTLVPGIVFESRPRLSNLTYTGFKKLTKMPKRSAVVAFSMDDVYGYADMIRRHRGGTAVVLGALSPRTRNAQVEMYQSGEVDFMVATDAIGMGLNMDIRHVALGGTRKYDGHKRRALRVSELAQIAGRAGRYLTDGTFGVTGHARALDEETVEAIEQHKFRSVQGVVWRNAALDYASPKALIKSLERRSDNPMLMRGRASDDYKSLVELAQNDEVLALACNPERMRLLWDVCQIPDFRKTMPDEHYGLLAQIYRRLTYGPLASDWVAGHVLRLDDTTGDVDALMTRLSYIRTWTYIAYKSQWIKDEGEWQGKSRAIEDRLSDALHEALIKRFVDRRQSLLMAAQEDDAELLAGVRANGDVVVEGHLIGHLKGFQFISDTQETGAQARAFKAAARKVLKHEIKRILNAMLNADNTQFQLAEDGQILYQATPNNPLPGQPLARLQKGEDILSPKVMMADSELLADQDKQAVRDKLAAWLKQHVATVLEPLVALEDTASLNGAAKGIAFQVHEALGIVPREHLEDLIADLSADDRRDLRYKNIRLGPVLVFIPKLNKPAAVRLRALLWGLWHEKSLPMDCPKDGIVSFEVDPKTADRAFYQAIAYPVYGGRAIRIDMLDRVICAVYDAAQEGKFQAQHQMAEWLGSTIEGLYEVLEAMGHVKVFDPVEEAAKAELGAGASGEEGDDEKPPEPSADAPHQEDAEKDGVQKDEAKKDETKKDDKALEQVKPDLATFRLKKGKAFSKARGQNSKHKKHDKKKGGKRNKSTNRTPKVMSVQAKKIEDSPFAILEQLKKTSDG